VKSLIRFRCVSKTWCSLIVSPHFIATHLNRALSKSNPKNPPYFLFHCFDYKDYKDSFTLRSSDDPFPLDDCILGSHTRELSLDQEIEEFYMEREMEMENFLQVVGSPNNSGVCLLWNPSIQKVILLPDPNIGANFGGFT
jgi:hypothetical protein